MFSTVRVYSRLLCVDLWQDKAAWATLIQCDEEYARPRAMGFGRVAGDHHGQNQNYLAKNPP